MSRFQIPEPPDQTTAATPADARTDTAIGPQVATSTLTAPAPTAGDRPPAPQASSPDTPGTDTPNPDTARPARRPLWRRGWFQWLVGIAFTVTLITVLVLVLLSQASKGGRHDPRNAGPEGSAGLVALIQQEGVSVTVHTARSAPSVSSDTTVVITAGENITRQQFEQLLQRRPARVILAGFSPDDLSGLGFRIARYYGNSAPRLDPECGFRPASTAGDIENPGVLYTHTGGSLSPALSCYPADQQKGGYAYLQYNMSGVEVALISGGFENRALSSKGVAQTKGNAAFSMMLFGQSHDLVWWVVPQPPAQTGTGSGSTPSLLPDGIGWGFLAVVVLAAVVAVWRGRRLGPIITERLPVVVRASETVEGHGRMYHRLRAYDQAAQHLREGVMARLSRRFGTADPARLAEIVAERGRIPASTAHAALTGQPPTTEIELLELKQLLHDIEQEARS